MPGPRPLVHELAAGEPGLPAARSQLRSWLTHAVEDTIARHDLLLAGTELCTEALERQPTALVVLRAWVEHQAVVIEVTAPAGVPLHEVVPRIRAPRRDRRWRASILRQVCDEVSAAESGGARTVRCRRLTGGGPRPG